METKEAKTTGATPESNRTAGGRAKVIRDAEELLAALDTAMDKLPKNLRYSGSHAALAKQYGASMYAKMNSMAYCTEDPRARRSYCQAALGDYEALKLEKRLCFRRRGAVKDADGAKSPDAYYIGRGAAARIDELLGEVGRHMRRVNSYLGLLRHALTYGMRFRIWERTETLYRGIYAKTHIYSIHKLKTI